MYAVSDGCRLFICEIIIGDMHLERISLRQNAIRFLSREKEFAVQRVSF